MWARRRNFHKSQLGKEKMMGTYSLHLCDVVILWEIHPTLVHPVRNMKGTKGKVERSSLTADKWQWDFILGKTDERKERKDFLRYFSFADVVLWHYLNVMSLFVLVPYLTNKSFRFIQLRKHFVCYTSQKLQHWLM